MSRHIVKTGPPDDDHGDDWKGEPDETQVNEPNAPFCAFLPQDEERSPREDYRLVRRLHRLLGVIDKLREDLRDTRPVMADDLLGMRNLLDGFTTSIEGELIPPFDLRRAMQCECWSDSRRMSIRRFHHHCLIVRRAAHRLHKAHNATGAGCRCSNCYHAEMIRWFLSRAVHLTLRERKVSS